MHTPWSDLISCTRTVFHVATTSVVFEYVTCKQSNRQGNSLIPSSLLFMVASEYVTCKQSYWKCWGWQSALVLSFRNDQTLVCGGMPMASKFDRFYTNWPTYVLLNVLLSHIFQAHMVPHVLKLNVILAYFPAFLIVLFCMVHLVIFCMVHHAYGK
jgi:hypothetical protein